MVAVTVNGSSLGNALQSMLAAAAIQPGDAPSYELCKTIYEFHPLGGKLAEAPIALAQSQPRTISVPAGPEDRLREAFEQEWVKIRADDAIFDLVRLSRIYGAASLGIIIKDVAADKPIEFEKLYKQEIAFNVWDPLNTAGSLVLNQTPNQIDFLKQDGIAVSGEPYHRSRTLVKFNERPIYLGYTNSAFGYVGRSVYQRALYPLKSFIASMVTDDMVVRKAGVLVMKLKAPGAIIDKIMTTIWSIKREILKEAETNNVITVGHDDSVETLNMQNIDGAYGLARTNLLKNVATAADMPARMVENETMVSGFGEGTEDAKNIAHWIDRFRTDMQTIYQWFDQIVQYRAWNPEFYATIQKQFPDEYGSKDYKTAFYAWRNSFKAEWPSLLTEPDSDKIKVDDVRLKAVIALVEVLLPAMDPENKAVVLQWAADNFNELPLLFTSPLNLDYEALAAYTPPQPPGQPGEDGEEGDNGPEEPKPPAPFAQSDGEVLPYEVLKDLAARIDAMERGCAH